MLAKQAETQFGMHFMANLPFLCISLKLLHKFVESLANSDRLVAKLARRALKLDSVNGPNQLIVVAMKIAAHIFADRGQLYRSFCT